MTLCIQDDGCGYEPETAPHGLGIIGMSERARLLGGTVTIHSQPGEGTTVQATIPGPAIHDTENARTCEKHHVATVQAKPLERMKKHGNRDK
jgi:signal transduction histidine kinase